jgi:hypothetical protein
MIDRFGSFTVSKFLNRMTWKISAEKLAKEALGNTHCASGATIILGHDTGRRLSPSHAKARILSYTGGKASLYYSYHLLPLRVLKQLVCMFFSTNAPRFRSVHPDLEKFVLNRDERYLDPNLHIFAFLSSSIRSRQIGVAALLNLDTHKVKLVSEIPFHPWVL